MSNHPPVEIKNDTVTTYIRTAVYYLKFKYSMTLGGGGAGSSKRCFRYLLATHGDRYDYKEQNEGTFAMGFSKKNRKTERPFNKDTNLKEHSA